MYKKENKTKINSPIYTVNGSELLDEHANIAMTLQKTIDDNYISLEILQDKLNKIGISLNIYINNIVNLSEPFDYQNNIVHFTEKDELCIYSLEEIKNIIEINKCKDFDGLISFLPECNNKYQFKPKQTKRCMNIVEEYNLLMFEFNNTNKKYKSYILQYNNLLQDVKNILSNIKIFEIDKNDLNETKESFNEKKHELLISYDNKQKKWKWVYINKKG